MRKLLFGVPVLVAAVAVALFAVSIGTSAAGPASAAGVVPQEVDMAVANACQGGQKIENPTTGGYDVFFGTFTIHLDITVTNSANGPLVAFSSPDPGELVTSMYVKGGPTANFYNYGAGIQADSLLHAPVNPNNGKYYGLSHLCIFADKHSA